MNGVGQNQHGVQALSAASCCLICLFFIRFRQFRTQDSERGLFDVRCRLRDLFSAEEVDTDECNGKIKGGQNEIYPSCIPSVRLYEILESLRKRGIWW